MGPVRWKALLVALLILPAVVSCGLDTDASPTTLPSTVPTVRTTSAAGPWWMPRVGATFHIQYSGKIDFTRQVDVYDLDWETTNAADVLALRARGVASICYLNAGAFEDFRSDKGSFPDQVLGEDLDGWPGERWLDVRRIDTLLPIMTARMDVCKAKGFVAIDPDNTDGWTQQTGFPITADDQVAYQQALAREAHARGLAIGLKNDGDQLAALGGEVDFAVNEECVANRECNIYRTFLAGGKAVFNIEYRGTAATVCPGRPDGMATVISTRQLSGKITACP